MGGQGNVDLPELISGYSAFDHFGNQSPIAIDHFSTVEHSQLRELISFRRNDPD